MSIDFRKSSVAAFYIHPSPSVDPLYLFPTTADPRLVGWTVEYPIKHTLSLFTTACG